VGIICSVERREAMLQTVWAVVREGKIELLENVQLAEGTKVLVTLVGAEDEERFWLAASETALADVWDNPQDDVYAQLLEK
jgi:hypothetical protein